MKTILKGTSKEVVIDTEGPVVIIGECINPTRRKKLASTLQANDFSYMLELAKSQIDAMADVLDVNVGFPGVVDEELLPRAVIELQERFDIPLCLDSPNPKAIEAALKLSTSLAPRVLRLDPQRASADAGVMLAPGERDLDILANTLTPDRHLGYAVQWFGLAIAVLVVALVLTLRKTK